MPRRRGFWKRPWEGVSGVMAWAKNFFGRPLVRASFAVVGVLILGLVFNADGAFFKIGTHRDALRQISVYGCLACGMTMVVISGGIDLAVGSVLALCAVFVSLAMLQWGWSPWVAIPATLALGTLVGSVSGLLVAWGKMQPFIATLAVMVSARGLAKLISGGEKISTAIALPDGSMKYVPVPGAFRAIDSQLLGGNVSTVTLIFLVCLLVSWIAMDRHRWGRYIYAIGGNEEAARLSGVPVFTSKLLVYAASGLFAAVAGICQAAQEQQGDPEAGTGYELTAIAIVVMGGTSLMGGRGGIGQTLIGMLTIGYLEKILSVNAVSESWRLILTGAIIGAAVFAQRNGQEANRA
jgi:ribose transport system permease protein